MAKRKQGNMGQAYRAEDIEVLEGLEPVRKRPGMYIAGTDTPAGLHQLVFEILDNSVDEAMNGHANSIVVTLHSDGQSVTVEDNGRGIPVEKHPRYGVSALELILTTLHAGGKFSNKNYQTSGGLHGVGSSVVNALSEHLVAVVKRAGKRYEQHFERGKSLGAMKSSSKDAEGTGTAIFFRPDSEIFSSINFSSKILREAIQTKAYLNPGLRIAFVDEKHEEKHEFFYQEGLIAYLRQLLQERKVQPIGDEIFVIEKNDPASDEVQIAVTLCWTEEPREEFLSYANGIHTVDGGSHESGAKQGVVKALRNWIAVHDVQTKGVKISADDIREGLICLVSVKLPSGRYHVQFQGQTKGRLNNPEVEPIVESAMKVLEQQLNEKPNVANLIVNRIILSAKARAASRQAAETVKRKIGISHRLTLPGKLADCSSMKPAETELFIVEGDSAGGSAKQGRDRHFQAVLPLRGKILNTIAASDKSAADNKELANIVSALGCGVGKDLKSQKIRYGKVIILTDADADGMHIATLLLAFFFKHMKPLIECGHIYIGKPPLYGVFPKGRSEQAAAVEGKAETSTERSSGATSVTDKKTPKKRGRASAGANVYWVYSDQELQKVIKDHKLNSPRIVRYKGLGEMNPETLWETTLDPKSRTLLRVTGADEADIQANLEALMGTDPSMRSKLITENAAQLEVDL